MSENPDFKCLPVKLLFHCNYWDGPLSGVCEYFKTHDDFVKEAWQYAIGYTTEDVWDREDYNKERLKKD